MVSFLLERRIWNGLCRTFGIRRNGIKRGGFLNASNGLAMMSLVRALKRPKRLCGERHHAVNGVAMLKPTTVPTVFSVFGLLIFASFAHAQTITGTVSDTQNRPIINAVVTLQTRETIFARTTTDQYGEFSVNHPNATEMSLIVEAEGFTVFTRKLSNDGVRDFSIILQPAQISAGVTISITRTETRLSETPASVVVLSRDTLDSTAAQTVDDSLRQIAGFTLFRRGSSKTANPTTQGANLRGVSGSGASRSAVLFDGLSLNDAFGGWTYWSRVPQIAVEQAEVLRGGASSLYGTGGLSGAVNLVPLKNSDEAAILNIRASLGSQNTADGSLFTSAAKNGWAIDLAAETFQTGGYIPTAANERGLADTLANSRHNNGIFTIERKFGPKSSPPFKGGVAGFSSPPGLRRGADASSAGWSADGVAGGTSG